MADQWHAAFSAGECITQTLNSFTQTRLGSLGSPNRPQVSETPAKNKVPPSGVVSVQWSKSVGQSSKLSDNSWVVLHSKLTWNRSYRNAPRWITTCAPACCRARPNWTLSLSSYPAWISWSCPAAFVVGVFYPGSTGRVVTVSAGPSQTVGP